MIRKSIVLDSRRKLASGLYPVKLYINFESPKYVPLGIEMSEAEWDKIEKGKKLSEVLFTIKGKLDDYKGFAGKIINALKPFSFEQFKYYLQQYVIYESTTEFDALVAGVPRIVVSEQLKVPDALSIIPTELPTTELHANLETSSPEPVTLLSAVVNTSVAYHPQHITIYSMYREKIKELEKEKAATSTVVGYTTAFNSVLACRRTQLLTGYRLCKYSNGRKKQTSFLKPLLLESFQYSCNLLGGLKYRMYFEELTIDFLLEYKTWMLRQLNTIATIGIYLRNVRHLYNRAIKIDPRYKMLYPFGHTGYSIAAGNNVKRAFEKNDLQRIFNYEPKCFQEKMSRAFWALTFLSNGLNLKDIALWKYGHIEGDQLTVKCRAKIKRTLKRVIPPIVIYLSEPINQIIASFGNPDRSPNNYIFPILSGGEDEQEIRRKVQNFNRVINKWNRKIAIELKLKKVNLLEARHSFATDAIRSGKATHFVMEALGQTNLLTTQNYIAGLPNIEKAQFAQQMVARFNIAV